MTTPKTNTPGGVLLGGAKKKEDEETCPSIDIAKKLKVGQNSHHVGLN
jgi:hypothetical protein